MKTTRRVDVVDTYHGHAVPDPYRWLEDQWSAEVRQWWTAQNAVARAHLDAIPIRKRLVDRIDALLSLPKVTAPVSRGGREFTVRNSGRDPQDVLYVDDRKLIDPVAEADGDVTAALAAFIPSPDGRFVVWARMTGGADWAMLRVRDTDTGADTADVIDWVKMPAVAWLPDSGGFLHCGLPAPKEEHVHTAVNPSPRVALRRLDDTADEVLLERPECAWLVPHVTDDGEWLVVEGYVGPFPRKAFVRPADGSADWRLLVDGADVTRFAGTLEGRLVFQQHENHPAGRIVTIDPTNPSDVRELLPTDADAPMAGFGASKVVAGVVVTVHTDIDAQQLRVTAADGATYPLDLPIRGCLALGGSPIGLAVESSADGESIVFGIASPIAPPTTLSHHLSGRRTTIVRPAEREYDARDYVSEREWATGLDGTAIPLTVLRRHSVTRDGNRPALVTAYGGFGITLGLVGFQPLLIPWLDEDGIVVIAGVRGGGELGEEWHAAGSLHNKQHTFDDVVATASHLHASGWSSPELSVFTGASNGGLTAAAVLTQHPNAFAAVVPQVPVTDMLRLGAFTLGASFTTEYGDVAVPADFEAINSYSPLHRVTDGTRYPATLIACGENDERCPPGVHAYKMVAALQHAQAGPAPILLRVSTDAGHGHGKARAAQIDELADVLAFMLDAAGKPA